jgi:hypothetical protein
MSIIKDAKNQLEFGLNPSLSLLAVDFRSLMRPSKIYEMDLTLDDTTGSSL